MASYPATVVDNDAYTSLALMSCHPMQAHLGDAEDALRNAKAALELAPQALPEGWALLALLLSAQLQHGLAAASADAGMAAAQPDLLRLLLKIKARVLAAAGARWAAPHPVPCGHR